MSILDVIREDLQTSAVLVVPLYLLEKALGGDSDALDRLDKQMEAVPRLNAEAVSVLTTLKADKMVEARGELFSEQAVDMIRRRLESFAYYYGDAEAKELLARLNAFEGRVEVGT